MTKVPIENPVINSPYVEPAQHFLTSVDGEITGEIDPRRRPSEFFVPVARPTKLSGQLTMDAFGGVQTAAAQRDRQRDPIDKASNR